ncbi:ATP-dependent DNA helicase DinG [Mesobacillus campisalis]|uniref:3'-5' exonuclease DinG n=1 Tax=Mesobacillus campisalis TaxID=1408103 RepID=A0A0M2SU08_9BACI|nr:ATP-dependent DNA helicase DinG [Mesobacillus campisalis]KKK37623.1 ATP-dependent DNA helicase DinG [Mesobacillus campisalis]
MSNKFVVIDLETTGNSPKKGDRIIQVGAVIIEDGKITGKYSSLVNPGKSIPAFIEELTGISDEMVKGAPAFAEIAGDIIELLEDAFFVAHNVFFDLGFLQEELQKAGFDGFFGQILDTVELSRILYPTADGYKLSDLAAQEGIVHDRPHQADSDAYVTAELLLILLEKLETFPYATLKNLCKLSASLKSDIYMLLEEVLLRKERAIEELPPWLEVYRGIALKREQMQAASDESGDFDYPQDDKQKQQLLEKVLPGFEMRKGQMEMMDEVFQALNNDQHVLIEAGTGIGKTLGYLVPAGFFSKMSGEKVVVSTFTTQLQHQLLANDLPRLQALFAFPVKAALLKGRDHYINLAKFELSLYEDDDNYDTTLTKMQILVWLLETETGDYDELNLSSGGVIYWNKVKSGPVTFMQTHHWQTRDFYFRARKQAENASLIITNHSMLLTDIAAGESVLPPYKYVIIDEAHHFEKAAGKHFGNTLDYMSVRLMLNQLGIYEQGQLFFRLETVLNKTGSKAAKGTADTINALILNLQQETDDLFKAASVLARNTNRQAGASRIQVTFNSKGASKAEQALRASAERFLFMLRDLLRSLEGRLEEVQHITGRISHEDKGYLEELAVLMMDMERTLRIVRSLFMEHKAKDICWIETDLRAVQNFTTIYARSANVAEQLKNHFFSSKKSVVLTSATLSVNHSFTYAKQELGIQGMAVREKMIPSPFRYDQQVQLIIPSDLPDIKTVKEMEYTAAIAGHIISIAEATRGRMLILFTSHDMLKKSYGLIKESGFLEDFVLIAQGITAGSRSRLTRSFQRFEKAILFGTSSFWEGVDIPGEDLSCLIIVRLPFSPPGDPIHEAKCEEIIGRGGNPFTELSLPEAVLRFKQGFGRLVRTSSDKGIVFVFDKRIITSTYGKSFLKSIPKVPVKQASLDEILPFIEEWL